MVVTTIRRRGIVVAGLIPSVFSRIQALGRLEPSVCLRPAHRPQAAKTGRLGQPEMSFFLRRRIKAVASAPFVNLRSIAWGPSPCTIASPRKPADGTERKRVERPFGDVRQNFFLARSLRKMKNLNAQLDRWPAMATNVRLDGGHAGDRCTSLGSGKSQTYKGFQAHRLILS